MKVQDLIEMLSAVSPDTECWLTDEKRLHIGYGFDAISIPVQDRARKMWQHKVTKTYVTVEKEMVTNFDGPSWTRVYDARGVYERMTTTDFIEKYEPVI